MPSSDIPGGLLRAASASYPHPLQLPLSEAPATLPERPEGTLSIAPLSLCLNIPAASANASGYHRELVDALITEIALRSPGLQRRPVTQLLWRNPFAHLSPAEVTEIMHHLANCFRLGSSHNSPTEHCAELHLKSVTEEHAALLKGLGFKQLLLQVESGTQLLLSGSTTAQQQVQRLRDYGFQNIGIKIAYGFDYQTLHQLRGLLDLVFSLQPDRVLLTEVADVCLWDDRCDALGRLASNPQSHFAMLYTALRNTGYRVLGNDCFVSPKDPLAKAQNEHRLRRTLGGYNATNAVDMLGLGPGACSQMGDSYYRNAINPSHYTQALQQLRPAFTHGLVLDQAGHLMRIAIDQLLCYHRLDTAYLQARYDIDLLPLVDKALATDKLKNLPPLLHKRSDRIDLTADGILHLLDICDALLEQGSL